jgi:hypothetical protein
MPPIAGLCTVADAARRLNVSRYRIARMIDAGELITFPLAGRAWVTLASIAALEARLSPVVFDSYVGAAA